MNWVRRNRKNGIKEHFSIDEKRSLDYKQWYIPWIWEDEQKRRIKSKWIGFNAILRVWGKVKGVSRNLILLWAVESKRKINKSGEWNESGKSNSVPHICMCAEADARHCVTTRQIYLSLQNYMNSCLRYQIKGNCTSYCNYFWWTVFPCWT